MGADDPMIETSITPNGGDALGVYGIARDLSAAGMGSLKNPDWGKLDYSKSDIIEMLDVSHQEIRR